jgi:hypothetical protein
MVTNYAIFEPFRNAVSKSETRSCIGKLFDIHADLERQAKRNNTRINEAELAQLWIFTPTVSSEILESFHGTLDETNLGKGIYFLSKGLKTVVVAIHQLPNTPETLFLRVLGRGKVQRQAVEELEALANSTLIPKTQSQLQELLSKNTEAHLSTEETDILDRLLAQIDYLNILKTRAK